MSSMPPVPAHQSHERSAADEFLIRPSAPSDLESFYALARLAGAGFTSLPVNEALLTERLAGSERAFAGGPGVLMLALEDRRTAMVAGCAAVKPAGTPRPDFLNFRIEDGNLSLKPTTDYRDLTEVGSLLLHPDYRKSGIGPWLSRSRYLLMAEELERFGATIFSELRGVVNDDDRSPFYDAVCLPHFNCSFAEADALSAYGEQARLNALLPKHPILIEQLAPDARAAIGNPHRAGRRALDYLKDDGFRYQGVVDLLDGGPVVVASSRSIRTIRESRLVRLRSGRQSEDSSLAAYIAVGSGPSFRCCRGTVTIDRDVAICSVDVLAKLEARTGAVARLHLVNEMKPRSDQRPLAASDMAASCEL